MNLLHDFSHPTDSRGCSPVEETMAVSCPPSIALDGLTHYFTSRGDALGLVIPHRPPGAAGIVPLELAVHVDHEVHPNRAMIARYDDRLVVRFRTTDREIFAGRITIRPLGSKTELHLKGHCSGISFGSAEFSKAIRTVLREIRATLEAQYAMLQAQPEPLVIA